MIIMICSSGFFGKEAHRVKEELEKMGHEILIYSNKIQVDGKILTPKEFHKMRRESFEGAYLDTKRKLMKAHIKFVEGSDAILVLNYDKDGKIGYVGGNTFMEICITYYLKKKIFMWKMPSEDQIHYEEIVAMEPEILNENLEIFGKL